MTQITVQTEYQTGLNFREKKLKRQYKENAKIHAHCNKPLCQVDRARASVLRCIILKGVSARTGLRTVHV